ncbi:hypothetical protein [Rhodospirillum sp. A1_3_36]|uniref:hypothetical protein n=1 Tax=Rhodospirillum sp. A1_3_36 TaxID=3391666 RepID=UPI0039A5C04E
MYPEETRLRLKEKVIGTNMRSDAPFELAAGLEGTVIISSPSVPDTQVLEFVIPGPNNSADPYDLSYVEVKLHDSQVEAVTGKTA